MASSQLQYLPIDTVAAQDPTGKFQRVFVDPASVVAVTAGPVGAVLTDTARTTAGATISGTLSHAAGKLVYVRGFRITAAPLAVAVSGEVTLAGLANGKTFSYEFAALVGSFAQLWEDFGEVGISANDGTTDIVLTVPALALATVSLNLWGYRV